MEEVTCDFCTKQFKSHNLKKHQWRCYQTNIEATTATEAIDRAILTADFGFDMIDTPASPTSPPNDDWYDSWDECSDSDPIPVLHSPNWSVDISFHPGIDRNTLAPDNDSTDGEEGVGSDEDPMFD